MSSTNRERKPNASNTTMTVVTQPTTLPQSSPQKRNSYELLGEAMTRYQREKNLKERQDNILREYFENGGRD